MRQSVRLALLVVWVIRVWTPLAAVGDGAPIAALGEGMVVWESNRGGHWRIWHRRLDGTDLRQLTPDAPAGEHYCPHINPTGTHVAYLLYPKGRSAYRDLPARETAELWIVGTNGVASRLTREACKAKGGNRAVVWVDANELLYLDGLGYPRRVDVRTGRTSERILQGDAGYLPNRQLTHAFGRFHVHAVDAGTGTLIKDGRNLGGCEAYFSHDGRWGIRVSGAGGPIERLDLATGALTPILEKRDPRMPAEWNYFYFPMVSRCQRLMACAASPGTHDHDRSDYEIFIAPIDAQTLQLRSDPVRYTFHEKTDRYPDVFLAPLR